VTSRASVTTIISTVIWDWFLRQGNRVITVIRVRSQSAVEVRLAGC
jgi:hypothetical protein